MRFGPAPASRWTDARDLLLPAIAWDGDQDEAYVAGQLDRGLAQLWIGEAGGEVRCAVVTCQSITARGMAFEIWLMGGETGRWLQYLPLMEDAARRRGCDFVTLTGRKGWSRLLPDYREKAVILEKGL